MKKETIKEVFEVFIFCAAGGVAAIGAALLMGLLFRLFLWAAGF